MSKSTVQDGSTIKYLYAEFDGSLKIDGYG